MTGIEKKNARTLLPNRSRKETLEGKKVERNINEGKTLAQPYMASSAPNYTHIPL